MAAIRDAVRCGLGVSFVSALNDAGQQPGLATLATTPVIRHKLSALHRRTPSHSAKTFLTLLRDKA